MENKAIEDGSFLVTNTLVAKETLPKTGQGSEALMISFSLLSLLAGTIMTRSKRK